MCEALRELMRPEIDAEIDLPTYSFAGGLIFLWTTCPMTSVLDCGIIRVIKAAKELIHVTNTWYLYTEFRQGFSKIDSLNKRDGSGIFLMVD